MSKLRLYHGSATLVRSPNLALCKPHNDYGRGFYCTRELELAREWACQQGRDGFANAYAIDVDGLEILDLSSGRFCMLHWLAILVEHRIFRITAPTMKQGSRWLHERFSVDLSNADIVTGYRADDSYFSFARAFLRNEITLEQLERAMRLGKLGKQHMIRSERAFEALEFESAEPVDSAIYWSKRAARDDQARMEFQAIASEGALTREGISDFKPPLYISTLMTMGEDDLHACLR